MAMSRILHLKEPMYQRLILSQDKINRERLSKNLEHLMIDDIVNNILDENLDKIDGNAIEKLDDQLYELFKSAKRLNASDRSKVINAIHAQLSIIGVEHLQKM